MVVDREKARWGAGWVAVILLLLPASLLAGSGCRSGPVLAFQGARDYAAGSQALERGDSDQAIALLERASRRVPHSSEIQNHLGLAHLRAGQLGRARTAFEHAIDLDCDNQAARANLQRVMNLPGTNSSFQTGTEAEVRAAESARIQPDRGGRSR